MTSGGGRRVEASSGGAAPLEELFAEIIRRLRQEARAAAREEIGDRPGDRPKYTTIARYAKAQGLGASTLRRWARAAGVQRQAAGKFLLADLAELVARGGAPEAPAAPPVADLGAARARRTAEALLGKGGRT